MMDEIEQIKKQVQQTINNRKNHSVTNNSHYDKQAGIYMLYIDYFEDETIIPIYIGQTMDLQKRWKDHKKKILALNHFSYDFLFEMFYSEKYFDSPYYNGQFMAIKFFTYMIKHHLKVSDLKMIVLEFSQSAALDNLEQKYIQSYYSSLVGFNQLSSLTLRKAKRNHKLVESALFWEIGNLDLFKDCGFTKFNYLYAFGIPHPDDPNFQIENSLREAGENLKTRLSDYYKFEKNPKEVEMDNLYKRNSELRSLIEVMKKETGQKLDDLFLELKIGNKKIIQDFHLYISTEYRDERQQIENRLRKYWSNRKLSKNFDEIGLEIYFAKFDEMLDSISKNDNSLTSLLKEAAILAPQYSVFSLLFPNKYSDPFPLSADNYVPAFSSTEKTAVISLYFSNAGTHSVSELIRVYIAYKSPDGCLVEHDYYLDSKIMDVVKNQKIEYIEKDFTQEMNFMRNPFRPVDRTRRSNGISVVAEVKHGVNDCLLKTAKVITLENSIAKEIDYLKNTLGYELLIYSSESKKLLYNILSRNGYDASNPLFVLLKKEKILKWNELSLPRKEVQFEQKD